MQMRLPRRHVQHSCSSACYYDLGAGMKEPFLSFTPNAVNKFFEGFSYKHSANLPALQID